MQHQSILVNVSEKVTVFKKYMLLCKVMKIYFFFLLYFYLFQFILYLNLTCFFCDGFHFLISMIGLIRLHDWWMSRTYEEFRSLEKALWSRIFEESFFVIEFKELSGVLDFFPQKLCLRWGNLPICFAQPLNFR